MNNRYNWIVGRRKKRKNKEIIANSKQKSHVLIDNNNEEKAKRWVIINMLNFLFPASIFRPCLRISRSEKGWRPRTSKLYWNILIHCLVIDCELSHALTIVTCLTFRSGLLQDVESIKDFWFNLISSIVSWRIFSLKQLSFFSPCIIKSAVIFVLNRRLNVDREN